MGMDAGEPLPGQAGQPGLDLAGVGQQFGGGGQFAVTAADSGVAYIDSAIIATAARFRFDAAFDFDEADRAEYFYSTWEQFGGKTDAATIGPNDSVDAQFFWLYYEHQLAYRLSAFVETPYILNDPSGTAGNVTVPGRSGSGIGDMIAGVKFLLVDHCDELVTFQLKNYIPTGDEDEWLTAGHYSIEPALLYFNRINDCWTLEAEVRDWISIGGAVNPENNLPYAGNVLRYGLGLTYHGFNSACWSFKPVTEVVGWSVLEGQKFAFNPNGPVDASGDTIVNLKLGARIARHGGRADIYLGYGTAVTDEAWYNDIVRAEYRVRF
jgi:hypothetical protein